MALSDLFFWSSADNETGLQNIRGDELAALLAASGLFPSTNIGLGAIAQGTTQPIGGFASEDAIHFNQIVQDDLGFLNVSSGSPRDTQFIVPDVDPPIQRVVFGGAFRYAPGGGGDYRSMNLRKNGNQQGSGIVFSQGGFGLAPVSQDATLGNRFSATSGQTVVNVGDVFTMIGNQDSGGNIDVQLPSAWIWVIR